MKLKFSKYDQMKKYFTIKNCPIVIYGAGMIGQIIMPYIIQDLGVVDNLLFYVDGDIAKQRTTIKVGSKKVTVKSTEVLTKLTKDTVILITNSNYSSVLVMLNKMEELEQNVGIIIPIILAEKVKNNYVSKAVKEVTNLTGITIPKKIHYCWFSGKPMPDYLEKCIDSWKRVCPDYEIIRWDESNYDVNKNVYMKQAYDAGKWGFIPDIARLEILYKYGGIYLDTDVEVIKNLDDLLTCEAFAGVEKWGNINMGGCSGATPHHPIIKKMLDFRIHEHFIRSDGTMNLTTCGYYETMPLIEMGYIPNNITQNINGMTIFSSDFFHPYDYMSGETIITNNTYSIHHFNGGWIDEKHKMLREKTREEYQAVLGTVNENIELEE